MMGGYTLQEINYDTKGYWRCWDCKLWWPHEIAHGHFKKSYEEKPSNNFLKELKEQNIKRNWRNL